MKSFLIGLILGLTSLTLYAQIGGGGGGINGGGGGSSVVATTCTNQAITAIAASTGAGTCTTLTSAYVDSSVATIGAANTFTAAQTVPAGSAGTPSLGFTGSNSSGIFSSGSGSIDISTSGNRNFSFGFGTFFILSDTATIYLGSSFDTPITRDAANVVAHRNGATSQGFNLYNTYTSSTNFERLMIDWKTVANTAMIYTQVGGGGGTARTLQLNYGGTTTSAVSIPITSGSILFGGAIRVAPVATGSLPTCNAGNEGAHHGVTDANATFTAGIGAVVANGGANHVPVYCDGTNWRIG